MLERIQDILRGYRRTGLSDDELTPAAVLVPLFVQDGQVHLLMERRTEKLDQHKGQVAFPGGVCDPEDRDAEATALREAWEEIGLAPDQVKVWGLLDDTTTVTGYRITPVVGRIPDRYVFEPNPDEVDSLLRVPWKLFSDGDGHTRSVMEHDGQVFETDFYPFEGLQIWGATARITRQLVELVEGEEPNPQEEK